MNIKNKVLFVFPDLIIGGATSAFLAFLHKIDYAKNDVDVLFLNNGTNRLHELPPQVRVLPDAVQIDLQSPFVRLKKILNFGLTGKVFKALWEAKNNRSQPFQKAFQMAVNQMLARIHSEMCSPLAQKYDIAIAYLELWPSVYVAEKVSANKKLAWVHVDYMKSGLNPGIDISTYQKMDHIMGVSAQCAERLITSFPQLQNKVSWTENYVDVARVRKKAEQDDAMEACYVQYEGFRIVTVARLDSYTKGLDRIINISSRLKKNGREFRWYIVGGGEDEQLLQDSIVCNGISDRVFLLGSKNNPYPYMKQANLFVLTSRNEGKPITVSEAQILHLPILTTDYSSAQQQLGNGNGVVVSNDEEALYQMLDKILSGEIKLNKTEYLMDEPSEILTALGLV